MAFYLDLVLAIAVATTGILLVDLRGLGRGVGLACFLLAVAGFSLHLVALPALRAMGRPEGAEREGISPLRAILYWGGGILMVASVLLALTSSPAPC
jgi:hypothetical protein